MLYTLYNAMGENEATWANGSAVLREDGTPWVHIELTMPEDLTAYPFWPWRRIRSQPFSTPGREGPSTWKSGMCSRTGSSRGRSTTSRAR